MSRDSFLRRTYSISEAEYDEMSITKAASVLYASASLVMAKISVLTIRTDRAAHGRF
jgi:hypothetical protein